MKIRTRILPITAALVLGGSALFPLSASAATIDDCRAESLPTTVCQNTPPQYAAAEARLDALNKSNAAANGWPPPPACIVAGEPQACLGPLMSAWIAQT
jgi:hypothetical protein